MILLQDGLDQMTENSCESKRTRLGLKVRKGKLIDTSTIQKDDCYSIDESTGAEGI